MMSDSEFTMWRAVFAFSFVDSVLSLEEQELLQSYMAKASFASDQLATLRNDLLYPKDVVELYNDITDPADKKRFCVLARAIVWCEGNMDAQEEKILKRVSCLKKDDEFLAASRDDEHLHDFYQHYAKAGVVGLMKEPPRIEIRA